MATGFDCAAAALGIIGLSVQLTNLCLRKRRGYQRSGKDLQDFRSSVSIFSRTLHYFGDTMDGLIKEKLGPAKDKGMRSLLVDIHTLVQRQTRDIQKSFSRLGALGDPKSSTIAQVKAKIMWIIVDARDVKELLASLEPIKSTMNLLVSTSNCDLLMRKIDQLGRDNKAISEEMVMKVKCYRGQIKMLKTEVREKQREYEALRTHVTYEANIPVSQLDWDHSIRQIVEHVQDLATQHISTSRVIMRDIGREEALSPSTETGSRNSAIPLSPPPIPRTPSPHEPNRDGLGYALFSDQSEQDFGVSAEPSEIFRDDVVEVGSAIVDLASEEPTVSGPRSPNTSVTAAYFACSRAVPNTSSQQEQTEGGSRNTQSPRNRMVVRNGKMVSKRWRTSRDDNDDAGSSSSDSE
ncbi:hypothetical protein H2200_011207 [Cladophialophora chaetospira]|uniref:Fungal N-terminal domain-containing protein n=1 Tax=Cladophialophora chaetospira TaxID=386627 RepID=A0AA39CDK1_9EURO|nr:hypothetical protein H2200_011207 [Cladophialophora chaetospira]